MNASVTTDYARVALQRRIMRRVHLIWFVRNVLPFFALELIGIGVLFVSILAYVSPSYILANIQVIASSPFNVLSYAIYAFLHTELVVQVLLFALAALGAFLLRSTFRGTWFVTSHISHSVNQRLRNQMHA